MSSAPTSASRDESASLNDRLIFWASFLTLVAAGIGFSVRSFVIADWGNQYGFTQTELGGISGGGLIGFGIAIIFFSFFSDLFGYGKIMLIAFLLHLFSAVVTFAATPVYNALGREATFVCLNVGMWLFALGNGTCEAVINPLTATLFPKNKTHWLNILHAGWPLGLIIGALVGVVLKQVPGSIPWEFKLGVFLVPVLVYGLLMFNRPFPKSEADTAGVSVPNMMGTVGFLGFAVAALFLGLALPKLLGDLGIKGVSPWVGYAAAAVIWLSYTVYSKFAVGSLLIAFLYVMHALVGYVELGTDSWITTISGRVLKSETIGLLAFIWTNLLMFVLRFFAGPIVHKTNPIGLLIFSAVMGIIGLYLLGLPQIDSIWLWIGAVTIYGIGKTFYWPTLLGVISERFPKGGALALGLSGGIGMLSAGMIGGPGIGYKQDLATVDQLKTYNPDAYERYAARVDDDQISDYKKRELKKDGFPVVKEFEVSWAPKVAGLDNAKLKVFDDFKANIAAVQKATIEAKADAKVPVPVVFSAERDSSFVLKVIEQGQPMSLSVTALTQKSFDEALAKAKADGKPEKEWPVLLKTTLDKDLDTLAKEKAEKKEVGPKLEANLNALRDWWEKDGAINYDVDNQPLEEARLHGAKTALTQTAFVPAALAIGFVLLYFYFMATGGYKQVHLDEKGETSTD